VEGQVPSEEAVAELLGIAQALLDDERARGQGLDAKTSTLAGFSGAILALTATLGPEIFARTSGAVAEALVRVLYVLTVAALAAGAVLAVAGVLRPQERLAIATQELERFGEFPLIASPRIEIQGRMINTVVEGLIHERRLNDRKARLTRYAGLALAGGFTGVAAQALALGLSAA
jgi:hypothetical protein